MNSPMQWSSAISRAADIDEAVDEACAALGAELPGEALHLVLAFATCAHTDAVARIARSTGRRPRRRAGSSRPPT